MGPPLLHCLPYDILAESIAAHLPAGFGRWPEEIVVASNGVAQAIAARLLDRFPGGVAGLRLETVETFATRIINEAGEFPRVATEEERRLAMRTAARSVSDPLTETRGAAAMLERTYRDVRDSGLTLRDLTPLRNRERVRVMIRVWEDYERLIGRLGGIDAADLLRRAAELIRGGADVGPQIAAGFYDMTGAQMAVLDALRAVEKLRAVYIPIDPDDPRSHAFARPFIARITGPTPQRSPQLKLRKAAWTITEYKTREEEARGVCGAVRAALDSGAPPSSIGIVARSLEPYDLHLLERFSRDFGFTVGAAVPIPLVAHRIGRATVALLRLRERNFPRGEVLEIVRSGLKLNTRINAEKADAETRQAQIAGGPSTSLRAREMKSYGVQDYIELVAELESITHAIDGSLLARLADSFRIEDDSDLAACEELDRIADLFIRAEAWDRPIDPSSILDALEQSTITQPPNNPTTQQPAVWAGPLATFRGRTFDHLFAIRMQDDVMPQRRIEDPLLPDAERRAAGVREIGNGRDEEQLLFRLLCRGASQAIHFSYASSDGFGKPLRPSHYLKTFALDEKPEKKAEILKNFSRFVQECGGPPRSERGGKPPQSKNRQLFLLARAGTRGIFDGYVASGALAARARSALEAISPTHLEDFGECPQKFLLKHILRVRDIDDPEHQIQIHHRDKGSLDHRILERFYRLLRREEMEEAGAELPRLPQVLRERLERVVDEQFDELMPPHNPAMRLIERRATKRVLREFVAADLQDLLERGLVPAHVEYKFGKKRENPDHPDPLVVDVDGIALRVEGMIDRIDRGGGQLRIVDYKSGKALRHTDLAGKIDRGVRLQLALYAMAAAEFLRVDPPAVTGTIKPLVRGEVAPEKFAFALGEKREGLLETLAIFVRAILRGSFPAFPAEKDFESCKYCPVNHSCRTKHDAEESRAVLAAGEPRTLLMEPAPSVVEGDR
jgi:RecB family exonuclease